MAARFAPPSGRPSHFFSRASGAASHEYSVYPQSPTAGLRPPAPSCGPRRHRKAGRIVGGHDPAGHPGFGLVSVASSVRLSEGPRVAPHLMRAAQKTALPQAGAPGNLLRKVLCAAGRNCTGAPKALASELQRHMCPAAIRRWGTQRHPLPDSPYAGRRVGRRRLRR